MVDDVWYILVGGQSPARPTSHRSIPYASLAVTSLNQVLAKCLTWTVAYKVNLVKDLVKQLS
jgi:hypothetical protein